MDIKKIVIIVCIVIVISILIFCLMSKEQNIENEVINNSISYNEVKEDISNEIVYEVFDEQGKKITTVEDIAEIKQYEYDSNYSEFAPNIIED